MSLKKRSSHRASLREKQFTGNNGGNALLRIPEKAEFELIDDVFISGNTSVKMTVLCRKDPYRNFEKEDQETDRNLETLPAKKLQPNFFMRLLSSKKNRQNVVVHLLPGNRGYKASVYNKRKDQAITITLGPEEGKNLDMLLKIIKTAKFI